MPSTDDFEDYENTAPEDDQPTAAEIEAARRLLAKVDEPLPDVTAPQVDDYVTEAVAQAKSKKGNRKQRRAAKVPEGAPKPQDHQKSSAARQAEAIDATIVLTLWDEEISVDRSTLIDNWDWQLGGIGTNPLRMVKGLLGDARFMWFCARSQSEGKAPMDAAAEIMNMFAEESGLGSQGNS